jgi:hypothetical protein
MILKYRNSEHEIGKSSLTVSSLNVPKREYRGLHREFGPLKLKMVSDWSLTDASSEIHIWDLSNYRSGG